MDDKDVPAILLLAATESSAGKVGCGRTTVYPMMCKLIRDEEMTYCRFVKHLLH